MTVVEKICEMVRALPAEQAAEVLTFVESVQAQHKEKKEDGLPDDLDELDKMTWPEFVRAVAGSWGDNFPTLEEIRAGEDQDIPRERREWRFR
ncbi:DUF2281 domain-containing protein [Leptolyngbya sp. BC1307]|uniref:DUF2281 domain-containing protein n=1 Tax=Leptolyngbya sp. BC1307 TaxID=2029589 RepID=UPI000EFC3E5D|nr:DUF2281 domain-containing protein [Leptolyngbya sp. BC1307]